MTEVLHLVAYSEDPSGLIATALAACPSGSYLALTQPAKDIDADIVAEGARRYGLSENVSGWCGVARKD